MAKALILRTCDANLKSYNGFQWPESGHVAAPDWDPKAECGNGLHGFLWGEGSGDLANWDATAKWLVAEIDADNAVDLEGKVKFPAADVLYVGDRIGATAFLAANGAAGRAIVGGTSTSGVGGTSTSGDGGTSTSGVGGTSTSGVGGTLDIEWWDITAGRYRKAIAYVGENGIEPNKPYRLDENHNFIAVPPITKTQG